MARPLPVAHGLALCVTCLGCARTPSAPETEVIVTNTYLSCAVRDIAGDQTAVLCLAPPGMCPGHFDLSPSQVRQIRQAHTVFLFEFQRAFEQSLAKVRPHGQQVVAVKTSAGLCVPQTYLEVCAQVCRTLSEQQPARADSYRQRLDEVTRRINALAEDLKDRVRRAGLTGAKVVVSVHQQDFAQWLGLECTGRFLGSDSETIRQIDRAIREGQGSRTVIANRQEGTALASTLAEQMSVPMIVFSNFPADPNSGPGFDELLRANVRILVEAPAP